MESPERGAAVNGLTGDLDTFLDFFLTAFQHLDAKGGIGQYDVFLSWQRAVFQNSVEDSGRFLFGRAAHEFFGFGDLESQVGRLEDALVVVGRYLEIARQRDLVIAVNAVDDPVVNTDALIYLMIEAHLIEIGHAKQLAFGLAGIDQRAEQIENSRELQCLADGTHEFHGLGEKLGVQIDDARFIETAVQLVNVVREFDAVMLDDVGGTADRVQALFLAVTAGMWGVAYAGTVIARNWPVSIGRVNIACVLFAALLVILMNSPVLDPLRLSAEDQISRLRSGEIQPEDFDYKYLASLGRYGREKLDMLNSGNDPAKSDPPSEIVHGNVIMVFSPSKVELLSQDRSLIGTIYGYFPPTESRSVKAVPVPPDYEIDGNIYRPDYVR